MTASIPTPREQAASAEYAVRAAGIADLEAVIAIASNGQPESAVPGPARRPVAELPEYARLLTDARYFLVATVGGEVVGFLIGHTEQGLRPDETAEMQIARQLGPSIVIREVAVAPSWRRRGIARLLYQQVLAEAGERPVIATVVSDPANVAAIRFHYGMGFEPYRVADATDGAAVKYVWLFRSRSMRLLLNQYAHAIDLYKHEDNLNWNKLNNLLYVTTALFAAYGVLVTMGTNRPGFDPLDFLLLGVCLLGLTASVVFLTTLIAGVTYLDARKAALTHIEEQLMMAGGARIISADVGQRKFTRLRLSPTRHLLRGLPLALATAWLTAAAVVVFVAL